MQDLAKSRKTLRGLARNDRLSPKPGFSENWFMGKNGEGFERSGSWDGADRGQGSGLLIRTSRPDGIVPSLVPT
jgi:hypothetical protein